MYIFDTDTFRNLKFYSPDIFKTIWTTLDTLVASDKLISTREVWNELENGNKDLPPMPWLIERKSTIFKTPTSDETRFVAEIFKVTHFQGLISERNRLKGSPVADPFVISCAKVKNGTVVTYEKFKPNANKIPNVCNHFDVPCINFDEFMKIQGWEF